jgi:sigma-B regulation protein RsbU (phosphoserine phosphatase)
MDKQNGKYFTIFYGVFRKADRTLTYCNAAHPPGLLFAGSELQQLESTDPMVGMLPPGTPFESKTVTVAANARLFVYSDGAFEIDKPGGGMWKHSEFVEFLAPRAGAGDVLDQLYAHVKEIRGGDVLNDDCSILDVRL